MSSGLAFTIVALIAFILGVRGSVRLTRRYHDVTPELVEGERLILAAFVVVSWLITLVAGYLIAVTARRLLGFQPLEWTPLVTLLLASLVLLIPAGLDLVVARVARVPWRNGG